MSGRCSVCGETDPMPAWFCVMRVHGNAEQGEPCSYSVEGDARLRAEMQRWDDEDAGRAALAAASGRARTVEEASSG